MKKLLVLALALALAAPACSWFKEKPDDRSAEQLVADAMEAFNKEDYRDAIMDFEKLRDRYPFSKFLIVAELKLADAYYNDGQYEEAIVAYEHFEGMHPNNEAIPEVTFKLGMCYYEQRNSPDRDKLPSLEALTTFNRLVTRFPDTPYAGKAQEPIKECNRLLAEHDFLIGKFYYRERKYAAALARFEKILVSYQDVGVHQKAIDYIGKCKGKMGDTQDS